MTYISIPTFTMLRQTRTIAFYTLLEALRNRLAWLVLITLFAGIGISGFLNELALTESRQVQVALLAAFLRFAAVFLLATFVVTSMVRESNDKGLELLLALPLPRAGYLLGKLAGFATLALVPALLFGSLLLMLTPWTQAVLWTASLIAECWIIAAFSLLCVLTFNQIMAALSSVIAFYLLARSIGALELIEATAVGSQTLAQQAIKLLVDGLSAVLPHLDNFTRTEWLVYHTGNLAALWPLLAQTSIYLCLLAGAAMFDLYRKNI